MSFIMATVEIKEPREQEAHFGLYRTSAGGDESIIVRRKIGEPTDYQHLKSKKLALQRQYLALASQHYAHLTPDQKAITRHQFREVEFIDSHGKTDSKLLSGRQLFISEEIHSLATTGEQLKIPYSLCIKLTDESLNSLDGELWLKYLEDEEWKNAKKEDLGAGNWLYSTVPRDKEAYRPYGEAVGYHDPELPQHQHMSEAEIVPYHYHRLEIDTDILYRLYQLPYSRLTWTGGNWAERWFETPIDQLVQIVFYATIRPTDYQGTLTLGFADLYVGVPPSEWLGKRDWVVSWNYGSTYNYLAILDASMLGVMERYRKWVWCTPQPGLHTLGVMDTWLLTEPIIPL